MFGIPVSRRAGILLSVVPVMATLALSPAATASASTAGTHGAPTVTPQVSGTTKRLQAVSAVNSRVVWASGLGGTYTVTTDGGAHWHPGVVPGAETLQFRDVQAVSARTAYLLSAGSGSDSRIYKTTNGGATWTLQFQASNDPNNFYDCFAFWNPRRGLTMADGNNGRFPALRTTDGTTWHDIGNNLPAAQPNEGAFAASGTCVATQGSRRAWIVTTNSRVFATADGGNTWAAYSTPIPGGTGTAGVFTVAFRDAAHGMIGGGDFLAPTPAEAARSSNGGKTWQLTSSPGFPGAAFGLAYAGESRTVVATGPGGAAWTANEGGTWTLVPGQTGYWAVTFANKHVGWLVGTQGRILRITFAGSEDD
ncbi:MAG: hypothetical protein M3Z11_11270 [Candidatus Dormibacteraeota bacterium]|nr:hypothetical protein [Candidatus Dormibacteraeota bacterium]